MKSNIISFIGVSYDELRSLPLEDLEIKIAQNIKPYFENISNMTVSEMVNLRENVKDTRKEKFRFSQETTKNISKERIQLALMYLANLFRKLNCEIKDQRNI